MKQKRFLDALRGDSGQKINLYVTGGGQNSAFTAGMLAAIATEGWTDKFQYYIGQSSGSFSLMFFLSEETYQGASGYWRALPKAFNNRRLVNPWHLFNPFRSVLDLHYMVDEMFDTDPRIPWDRVLAHPVNQSGRLLIQVLDARTGKNVFLSHFATTRALRAAIKASSWIPLLAGMRPFYMDKELVSEMHVSDFEGHQLQLDELHTYDGQLANSFFGDTYRARPDDLHMVLTNIALDGRGQLTNPFGPSLLWLERPLSWILFWWCLRALRAYHKSMLNGGQRRDFDALHAETVDERTNILGVFPVRNIPIGQYTLDETKMRQAVLGGFNGLYTALGLPAGRAPWPVSEERSDTVFPTPSLNEKTVVGQLDTVYK